MNQNENDTWYRCTICGREGRVGRCCGEDTREPLNYTARQEQELEKLKNRVLYRPTTFA